jgi:hypothetical protein
MDEAVTRPPFIRAISDSNLGWGTDHSDTLRGIPQSLQTNARIVPSIGPWLFSSVYFPISYHPDILSYTDSVTDRAIKYIRQLE